jgi:hypothetical protein
MLSDFKCDSLSYFLLGAFFGTIESKDGTNATFFETTYRISGRYIDRF